MAGNSTNAAKMARFLAIIQIVTGVLLIGFGTADRLVKGRGYYHYYHYDWTGYVYFGIWIGIWMCITGGLGIPGSARERTSSRNAFAGVFMGFSITSAVLGGVIIICYSIAISQLRRYHSYYDYDYYRYYERYYYNYRGKMAILAIMLILGIVTFGAGIWAAICTCLMKPCGCCGQPPVDQQMYGYPVSGYVMSAGGAPVAIPMQAMQAGASGAAAQGYHQPMVLVPVSGAAGGQQLIAQATSPGGIVTGTLQQQQMEAGMSHSFVDTRGYAAKPKEQMQVAV